jgi:hypothetical protein
MYEQQFDTVGEDGTVHTVIVSWPPIREKRTILGATNTTRGMPTLHLFDGRVVSPVDKGTFRIVETGELLRIL